MTDKRRSRLLATLGPGILVAATGVGAGDLATAAFTGSHLGVAVLWAVVLGAGIKFVLNEGLARWQLATGKTLLEGCLYYFKLPAAIFFATYLVLWSFFLGSALISACGVATHAIVPVFENPSHAKVVFGILHSLVGVVLVELGGFRLFERVMSFCIAVMFVTVMTTAFMVRPDWSQVIEGLFLFRIPDWQGAGVSWTVALMGGIGGTLTVLCYGYWIREEGRFGPENLTVSRIDLGVGYLMTGLFGIAMVIIGSTITVEGKGAGLVVALGDQLGATLGPAARWAFLIGAWGAVFSSLLGVWQSVPYLFADFYDMTFPSHDRLRQPNVTTVNTRGLPYRGYLYALATVPMLSLGQGFSTIQKFYAILGACFMPILALVLLLLNGPASKIGPTLKNHWTTNVVLVLVLLFFIAAGVLELL